MKTSFAEKKNWILHQKLKLKNCFFPIENYDFKRVRIVKALNYKKKTLFIINTIQDIVTVHLIIKYFLLLF
jgi:hypothetical protein